MDTPFIGRLPPELLIAIATSIPDQSAIFRLATVCGYWYNVLTGTPAVWTSIDCRRGSRTAILLQRSKFYPIDITIDHPFSTQAVSLVTRHTSRMRSISVNLSSGQLGEVRFLLKKSARILETMNLGPAPSNPPCSSFFQGRFPALRTLRLEGYPFDLGQSAPAMTNGLTTLVLDNTRHHHLRDLLEYLEHCKNLVHLRIDLPNLQGTIPTSRVVSLPNLRELRLVHPPLTLQHLSFPSSANLNIRSPARGLSGGNSLAKVWAEDGLLKILKSYTIDSAIITLSEFSCLVGLSGPRLSLVEHTTVTTDRRTHFHSDYLDSLQSLPITTVEFLRIAHPPKSLLRGTLRPKSCSRLLQRMPALRRIVLDIPVMPFFVRALEPVNGRVPCPKLQDLVVVRRKGHKMDIRNSLFAFSNQRKRHGYPLVCAAGSSGLSWQDVAHLERIV